MIAPRLGVLLLVTFAVLRSPVGVEARQQARETAAKTPVGSAVVEGLVISDDADHRPIHRATVTLASGAFGLPQSVATDEAGAFVFTGVPAGNYTLEVSKGAYVETFYGAKRAGTGPGVPIAVVDGQHVSGLVLRMPHGSVLTGVLRYTNGRPASGVTVQITAFEQVSGQRRANPDAKTAITDDRGVYRVFGLAAGEYMIAARPASTLFALFSPVDTRPVTAEEIQWAQQALAQPAGAAPQPALGLPPAAGHAVAYAPVYYPGSAAPVDAAVLTLGVNEERSGLDFVLTAVPTATITGQIFGPDGAPAPGASVAIGSLESEATDLVGSIMSRMPGRPSADGSFSLYGITPGRYRLTARASPPSAKADADPSDPMRMLGAMMPGGGGLATLWGQEDVTIDGHDVGGLSIRLQPGLTVSGKVVFETATHPQTDQIRITLGPGPTGNSPADFVTTLMGAASAAVEADGAFSIKGLTPDRYRVTVMTGGLRSLMAMLQPEAADASPGALFLKTALWHGRDVADTPIDLKAGEDVTGVVVTLTDRPTTLSGTVRDGAGRPTPNYPILVFSTDRASWFPGSRRIQEARVATDGHFTIVGLPAGEYYVAALTDVSANERTDPSFLESILASSLRITLGDGEKKVQDLKLAGG
jgi:hypothetical protein